MNKREFIVQQSSPQVTKSAKETRQLAGILAKEIIVKAGKKAAVVALEGELGAGKTTFVKGFAKALGVKEKILSPTFVLIKSYRIATSYKLQALSQKNAKSKTYSLQPKTYSHIFHIDAYRLKDHRDLIPLGIKEILEDPQNIVLIEWSDRVKKILPKEYIKIHIDHIDKQIRKIIFQFLTNHAAHSFERP